MGELESTWKLLMPPVFEDVTRALEAEDDDDDAIDRGYAAMIFCDVV